MAHHHLEETTLLEYTAGALPEPVAMLAATHLALCTDCRSTHSVLESAGGALLEESLSDSSQALSQSEGIDGIRDAVFAQLDTPQPDPIDHSRNSPGPDLVIPRPLRDYLGGGLDDVQFRRISPALEVVDILPDYPEISTRLMKIAAGKAMPRHSHDGSEYTLVLDGGFSDGDVSFHRGDVAIADEHIDHTPVAEEGTDCICLAVNFAPVRLTGALGRLLNPFVKF